MKPLCFVAVITAECSQQTIISASRDYEWLHKVCLRSGARETKKSSHDNRRRPRLA
jgi:hypothetical protein